MLHSLYIFSILCFVIKNKNFFTTNSERHEHNTQQSHDLHFLTVNSRKYQSGVFYMGVKLYNSLPPYIKKEFSNIKKFESLLKTFLLDNIFYSLDEFYNFL